MIKWIKALLVIGAIVILIGSFSIYVYIGTYIFPIAPYWVTQLPPNPPRPKIKRGEFAFVLEYEISGERKVIEDTLICEFSGFEVNAVGGPKTRKWNNYYKNEHGYEIFTFRDEPSRYTKIVMESIDTYKVLLSVGPAEYFLGEPEYYDIPEMPCIQVYDTSTEYYIDPVEREELLDELNFKVISWYCDKPIENRFK